MHKDINDTVRMECLQNIIALQDAVEILSGKWRFAILAALNMKKNLCFNELKSELPYISAKVLTQELRFLEKHKLVSRLEQSSRPLKVIYSLSPYSYTLDDAVLSLLRWGLGHRHLMLEKEIGAEEIEKSVAEVRSNYNNVHQIR